MKDQQTLVNDLESAGFTTATTPPDTDLHPDGILIEDVGDLFECLCSVYQVYRSYANGDGDFGMKLLQPDDPGYAAPSPEEWGMEEQLDFDALQKDCFDIATALRNAGWHVLPMMLHGEVSDNVDAIFAMEHLPQDCDYSADEKLLEKLRP